MFLLSKPIPVVRQAKGSQNVEGREEETRQGVSGNAISEDCQGKGWETVDDFRDLLIRIMSNWSLQKDSRTIKLKELTARRNQAKLKTPQHERSDTATSRRRGHDDSDEDDSDSRESSPEKQKHAATPARREKEKKLGWSPSHSSRLCHVSVLCLICVV